MSVATDAQAETSAAADLNGSTDEAIIAPREKALTIGAVRKTLAKEFGDVSISKIRYLEDQKLLTPKRTEGGYRVYTQSDVARLRTILRLQRDEYLPLRVIRQELSALSDWPTIPQLLKHAQRLLKMGCGLVIAARNQV